MNDYDIIVKIGAWGSSPEEVMDKYEDILFFITDKVGEDLVEFEIVKRGEWVE